MSSESSLVPYHLSSDSSSDSEEEGQGFAAGGTTPLTSGAPGIEAQVHPLHGYGLANPDPLTASTFSTDTDTSKPEYLHSLIFHLVRSLHGSPLADRSRIISVIEDSQLYLANFSKFARFNKYNQYPVVVELSMFGQRMANLCPSLHSNESILNMGLNFSPYYSDDHTVHDGNVELRALGETLNSIMDCCPQSDIWKERVECINSFRPFIDSFDFDFYDSIPFLSTLPFLDPLLRITKIFKNSPIKLALSHIANYHWNQGDNYNPLIKPPVIVLPDLPYWQSVNPIGAVYPERALEFIETRISRRQKLAGPAILPPS